MKQGFWNGEPVKYEVHEVIIKEATEFEMPWTAPFVGQVRQTVKVITAGEKFFIDNEDGSGLHKLYNGGMMFDMHRSITNYELKRIVPECEWITEFNKDKSLEIDAETNVYWKKHNPEAFARIEYLRNNPPKFSPFIAGHGITGTKELSLEHMFTECGICQVCGCTDDNACTHPEKENCHWVDANHTLCSHCLDKFKAAASVLNIHIGVLRHGINELVTEQYQVEKNGIAKALLTTVDSIAKLLISPDDRKQISEEVNLQSILRRAGELQDFPLVQVEKPIKHSDKTIGRIKAIKTDCIAVRFPDMSWNTWFHFESGSDRRRHYTVELKFAAAASM